MNGHTKELVAFFMAYPFLKTRQRTVKNQVIRSGDGQGCVKYLQQTPEFRVWGQAVVDGPSRNFTVTILQLVLLLGLPTRGFLHHRGLAPGLRGKGSGQALRSARKRCSLQLCGARRYLQGNATFSCQRRF